MRTVVVEQPACAAAKITKRAIGPDRNRPKAQSWPADPAGGGLGIEEFIVVRVQAGRAGVLG
jgi:hypothetical protein